MADSQDATERIEVLRGSADRLAALVGSLTPDDLRVQAYPTEWTVADVLSHLGSGAVISRLRMDATRSGRELEQSASQGVWDEWNAKDPDAQAANALVADRALLDLIDSLTAEERDRFRSPFGPLELDLAGFVGFRLNEHALHTWDVAVTFDPAAAVPADAAAVVMDSLPTIARFAGKPTGADRVIAIATTGPERHVTVTLRPDGVAFEPNSGDTADLTLPAEALVRLVYGRLDPPHTPSLAGDPADLDELRRVFPGF